MELIGAIYGWGMAVAFACMVVVPYLLRKRHLLTTWNFFLVGSISFFAVNAAQTLPDSSANGEFQSSVYTRFMLSGFIFYVIAALVYFWPMKKAPRVITYIATKLPYPTPAYVLTAAIVCLALSISIFALPPIPLIGHIIGNNSSEAAIAAAALTFWLFLRSPLLPLTWYVVVPIFALAVVLTLVGQIGRQPLLSLFIAIPFVFYWFAAKRWKPFPTLITIMIAGFIAVVILTGYSRVRHATNEIQDPIDRAITRVKKIPEAVLSLRSASALTSEIQGQNAVWCSLVTIDLTDDATLKQEPLFTLKFMLANWVPRQFWENKPTTLGYRLPLVYRFPSPVNWGPGIVGHMYHEGGWWMILLYAPLIGFFFRHLDYAIAQFGDNPFVLAVVIPVAGQFIALSRGDLGLFLFQIMGAFIYLYFIFWLLRTITAQQHIYVNDGRMGSVPS